MSFWKDAFKPVKPGETPPPPPASLRTWTSQTMYGTLGGMLYGGYRGLLQARNPSIPSPVPTNSVQHRMRVFFVRESILVGARIGLFSTTFSATALLAEKWMGEKAAVNYAMAGGFTCGLFAGGVAGGWVVPMATGFGAVVGGVVGGVTDGLKSFVDHPMEELGDGDGKVGDEVGAARMGGSIKAVMQMLEERVQERAEADAPEQ